MAKLSIIGSGGPPPDPDRFGSSYVLRIGGEYLMFDCGPATTYKLARMGMSPTQIDNLFFTHHHFDHDVDYPCFLLSRWDIGSGQENKLNVYGPTLTEQLTERIMDEKVGAFAHDWIARINHPLSLGAYTSRGGVLPRKPPTLNATDIGPDQVITGRNWQVTTASAEHVEPWLDSLAYRVDTDEGSFVFTGDTRPCLSVEKLSRGADVVVFVCVGIQDEISDKPESLYMCGTTDAGKLAQRAEAKKLVLVHNLFIGDHGPMERAVSDIAKVYDGQIIVGEEMMDVPLDPRQ